MINQVGSTSALTIDDTGVNFSGSGAVVSFFIRGRGVGRGNLRAKDFNTLFPIETVYYQEAGHGQHCFTLRRPDPAG